MKDIAIIMINYNNAGYTLQCIDSVMDKTPLGIDYQVIVVDNNSEPDDYEKLRASFPSDPRCSLYRSLVNTGFGGGNMLGYQQAKANYLLFLNNDTLFINDCISILLCYMRNHENLGVCTAQNYDEHDHLVPSFDHNKGFRRLLFGRSFLEAVNPKRYPKRKIPYSEPIEVDWVNGAFLFFRTEAFRKIGGFDTNIFLYWEEMDLCHRLRKAGYSVKLVPEAKILHYQGVSIGKSKPINKEAYRSYLYVIKKNHGILKYIAVKFYLMIVFLLKPKKWYLIKLLFSWNPMKHSLKTLQKVREDARGDQ